MIWSEIKQVVYKARNDNIKKLKLQPPFLYRSLGCICFRQSRYSISKRGVPYKGSVYLVRNAIPEYREFNHLIHGLALDKFLHFRASRNRRAINPMAIDRNDLIINIKA